MSKTANTRPWEVQQDDTYNPGFIKHDHRFGPCDYERDNNVRRPTAACYRRVRHTGDENAMGGRAKELKQNATRRSRRIQNVQLHVAAREGYDSNDELAIKAHPYDTVAYAIWSY